MNDFSANLWNFDLSYFLYGLKEEFLMDVSGRKFELVFVSGADQSCRQNQEFSAQSLQGSRMPFPWQAESPEPIDQVVSQEDDLKVNFVGQKTVGRNLAQRETFFEFSDVQFCASPLSVEMPDCLWLQSQIRNKEMIKVVFEFPEAQL